MSAKLLGSKPLSVPLPPVHIEGLGKGRDGVTPGDAAKVVFKSFTDSVVKAVTGIPGLGAAMDEAKKAVDGAKQAVGDIGNSAKQAVSGFTGLFGKKKK